LQPAQLKALDIINSKPVIAERRGDEDIGDPDVGAMPDLSKVSNRNKNAKQEWDENGDAVYGRNMAEKIRAEPSELYRSP